MWHRIVRRITIPLILLVLLTLVGAILRFTDLNWDMGGRLHPDEALIVNGALAIRFFSHLFPGFHDYNGFSIYLLRIASATMTSVTGQAVWLTTAEGMTLVGRYLSAAFATLSIPLTFGVGSLTMGTSVGLIAATLVTFTPLLIQLAHFYTTDTVLVFFLLLLFHMIVVYWRHPRLRYVFAAACATGLTLATKNTAYFFIPLPLAALALSKGTIREKVVPLVLFASVSVGIFFLGSPYSFLDIGNYITRSKWIADVVNGTILFEWSAQFQHTTPLFWFENLVVALGASAIAGPLGIFAILSRRTFRRRTSRAFPLVLLSFWAVGFSVFLSLTYLKFIRYDAPLIPVYALLAAVLLTSLDKSRTGKSIVAVVLSAHILWGVMVYHVYLIPHTSLTATDWISTHVPTHSTIMFESWNSIINFDRPVLHARDYQLLPINFYLSESPGKSALITEALMKSNYVIIESPKVRNTIHRMGTGFAATEGFYRNLESGKLGFTKVAQFTSYPQLGPFVINDEHAEETWTVFDHPTVTIYQKTAR